MLDPEAEDLLLTVEPDAQGNIDGLVADHAFVADLDPQGVEENQRIEVLERPVLPFRHLVEDVLGDRADQLGRDVDAVDLVEMAADLPEAASAAAPREQRDGAIELEVGDVMVRLLIDSAAE